MAGVTVPSLVNTIETEIERARQDLKGVDENLRRLTGRDFNEGSSQRPDLRRVRLASTGRDDEPPAKRRPPGGVFARLGAVVLEQHHNEARGRARGGGGAGEQRGGMMGMRGGGVGEMRGVRGEGRGGFDHRGRGGIVRPDPTPSPNHHHQDLRTEIHGDSRSRRVQEVAEADDKMPKPSLASFVARPVCDNKSRTEAAAELTKDRATLDRSRRMFGVVLGTLKKFKNDEAKQKDKEEQRAAIERKLEEKGRVEKEELRRERLELFNLRKERQAQIRRLTLKMNRIKEHEGWEAHQMMLAKFIRTESSPQIFWNPRIHNSRSNQLSRITHDKIIRELEYKRQQMKEELDQILGSRAEDDDDDDGRAGGVAGGEEDEDVDEEVFQHRGMRSQVARQGEGGPHSDHHLNCPDLLDFEAEEGELVYDEPVLSGKDEPSDKGRMVVQVDGRGAGGRKVEIVAGQGGGGGGEAGGGGGEGNDSEKENEGRRKERDRSREEKRREKDRDRGERKSKDRGKEKGKDSEKEISKGRDGKDRTSSGKGRDKSKDTREVDREKSSDGARQRDSIDMEDEDELATTIVHIKIEKDDEIDSRDPTDPILKIVKEEKPDKPVTGKKGKDSGTTEPNVEEASPSVSAYQPPPPVDSIPPPPLPPSATSSSPPPPPLPPASSSPPPLPSSPPQTSPKHTSEPMEAEDNAENEKIETGEEKDTGCDLASTKPSESPKVQNNQSEKMVSPQDKKMHKEESAESGGKPSKVKQQQKEDKKKVEGVSEAAGGGGSNNKVKVKSKVSNNKLKSEGGTSEPWVAIDLSDQHILYNDIFERYNKHLMPTLSHEDIIEVHFEIALFNVLSLDTKRGIMVTNTEVIMLWKDPYLSWDPNSYNNTKEMRVLYSDIWHPDVILYNTADTSYESSLINTNIIVSHDGTCKLLTHAVFTSVCDVDVQWFPFDQQICDLIFSSWTADVNHMRLDKGPSDITRFHPNQEFFLENFYSESYDDFDPCCDEPFSIITYHVQLQRRVKFALFFFIMPGVLINICALLVFSLPAETGEKIGLGINSMLAMIVFLMAMTENLPPTQSLPLAGVYYGVCLIVLTFNIIFSVYVLNLSYSGDRGHAVPDWLRSWVLWVAWLVGVKVPDFIKTAWIQDEKEMKGGVDKTNEVFPFKDGDNVSVHMVNVKPTHVYEGPGVFKEPFQRRSVEALEGIHRILEAEANETHIQSTKTRLSEQWKFMSRVLDRILFITFGATTLLFNVIILTQSPFGEKFEYCPIGKGNCDEDFDFSSIGGLDHF
ncbi:hypothetical protein Pmani_007855 [Petrolisthes manimaculis]|uniref:Uncharacterized protein n=1 Tax=Petrolisthes manimaculis TaxID=1843537 RepID=A0AAE1UJM3_9EUCA|nr:hypothetical protein Pmani_007855 [Petrolisthes manimaculis]